MRVSPGTVQVAGLLALLAATPATCLGASAHEIRRVILSNRDCLQALEVGIVQHAQSSSRSTFQEKWVIEGGRFLHEWRQRLAKADGTEQVEVHEAEASDGLIETHADYISKRGVVRQAGSRGEHHPVSGPWRLLGTAGAGLGDPLSWLEESVDLRQASDGLIRLHVTGGAGTPGAHDGGIRNRLFETRIITIDPTRGGVVLSLEDRDEHGSVLLQLENSEIVRSEGGAWYPRRTLLKRYAAGTVARHVTREVTHLRQRVGTAEEMSFRVDFPDGFLVNDKLARISYEAGHLYSFNRTASSLLEGYEEALSPADTIKITSAPTVEHPDQRALRGQALAPFHQKVESPALSGRSSPADVGPRFPVQRTVVIAALAAGAASLALVIRWHVCRRLASHEKCP